MTKHVQGISVPPVTPFNFNNHTVRVIDKDGNPWFIATDVCEALGYSNTSKAIGDHLDEDEKGITIGYTPGGEQKLVIISESGLYALVLRSRKPEARKFAKWVTSEVLPSIRKTGRYEAKPVELPSQPPHQLKFTHDNVTLHVLNIKGQPWFVEGDVCDALSIEKKDRNAALKFLDDEERDIGFLQTPTGKQPVPIINEAGLYGLIFSRCKTKSKAFKQWLTSTVLPALRQTGLMQLQVIQPEIERPQLPFCLPPPEQKKYHYPKSLLDQPYFTRGGDGSYHYPRLSPNTLMDPLFQSPLSALLNELQTDGHEVYGPLIEYTAMRELLSKVESWREDIERFAGRMCFEKPAQATKMVRN